MNILSKKEVFMKRSGQAALEFLATYSWAMLTILILILAMASLGLLSSSRLVGSQCVLEPGLVCADFKVETERIVLVVQNGLSQIATISQVDVFKNNGNGCSLATAVSLQDQQKAILSLIGCNNGNINEKFIGTINVTYSKGTIVHHNKGSLTDKIVSTDAITSSLACQNAEMNNLCGGLDMVYGNGYKQSCCDEWSLCC